MKLSTAQQARDALESAKNGLLWYADAHPADKNGSDDEAIAVIDAALAALEVEIAQPVEPVECQFQTPDGRWLNFIGDPHKNATIASGKFPIRHLYTAPQAVNAELLEALRLILPMAKGYAALHPVGSNAAYCEQASAAIAKAGGAA